MKLDEVFPTSFIEKLNQLNSGNASISGDDEVGSFVDVEAILHELGFEIKKEPGFKVSGHICGRTITLDQSENSRRQRFSMAHELGHALQNSKEADRRDDSDNYSRAERQDEVFANAFAAQFLMPKAMVNRDIQDYIKAHNFNSSRLSDSQVNDIVKSVANTLKVSEQAMKYRIRRLRIFVPVEE